MHVLLVRSQSQTGEQGPLQVPDADTMFEQGDSLVVAGSAESIERFERLRA